jgi:hypothetical protein
MALVGAAAGFRALGLAHLTVIAEAGEAAVVLFLSDL